MAKPQFQEMSEQVFDALLEEKRVTYQSDLENFDHYKARKVKQCQTNLDKYVKEVERGYEVIIDELAKELK